MGQAACRNDVEDTAQAQCHFRSRDFFALGGFCAYLAVGLGEGHALLLWVAAVCIQARLLCNMLDGLVAVEAGKSEISLGSLLNVVRRLFRIAAQLKARA